MFYVLVFKTHFQPPVYFSARLNIVVWIKYSQKFYKHIVIYRFYILAILTRLGHIGSNLGALEGTYFSTSLAYIMKGAFPPR